LVTTALGALVSLLILSGIIPDIKSQVADLVPDIGGILEDAYERPYEPEVIEDSQPDGLGMPENNEPYEWMDLTEGEREILSDHSRGGFGYTLTETIFQSSDEGDGALEPTLSFDIRYPQVVEGIDKDIADKINAAIEQVSMSTYDRFYANPAEGVEAWLAELGAEGGDYRLESDVDYYVQYNDERLLSIVFVDHAFVGSIWNEIFSMRTINIDVASGEVWRQPREIIDIDEGTAGKWLQSARQIADSEFLTRIGIDGIRSILAGEEETADRYAANFFVDQEGDPCIVISFLYSDEEIILRGWSVGRLPVAELASSRNDSAFWDIMPVKKKES
jgi:hypothetical protein